MLDVSGQLKLQLWSEKYSKWYSLKSSRCGNYALCGAFSICNENSHDLPCGCLPGFKPASNDAWSKGNVSSGCVRETALNCTNNTNVQKDEFLHMSEVDWPHNPLYLEDIGNDKECQSACLNNCSCVAYAYDQKYDRKLDGNKLIRCLVWDGSLLNLKQLSAVDLYGNDFYLKLASPSIKNSKKN